MVLKEIEYFHFFPIVNMAAKYTKIDWEGILDAGF